MRVAINFYNHAFIYTAKIHYIVSYYLLTVKVITLEGLFT